jgi:DNA-directed RNA polymerase subunit L
MTIKVLEKKKDKLKVEVVGESHTLLNLLREKAWKVGAKQSAYIIKHPYLSQPEIIIRAKNPGKVLNDAAQLIIDDAKEFGKGFKRTLKR